MPALLHDLRPLVQCLRLVLVHDECLLFKAEITPARLLTVRRGLFDDSPVDVEVNSSSLEFPNVCEWTKTCSGASRCSLD